MAGLELGKRPPHLEGLLLSTWAKDQDINTAFPAVGLLDIPPYSLSLHVSKTDLSNRNVGKPMYHGYARGRSHMVYALQVLASVRTRSSRTPRQKRPSGTPG